jgi:hypothetical protein
MLLVVIVVLVGGAAVLLASVKSIQRLGEPGVKTIPIPGSKNLEVLLPETVLDFASEWQPQAFEVTNTLPRDTSFGRRRYEAPDKFWVDANVVLMGTDRGSIHKPDFCLTGAGWQIDHIEIVPVAIAKPVPYELSVIKLIASTTIKQEGTDRRVNGIYVYWYVCGDKISSDPTGSGRMWSMAKRLVTTGVLERWAYISYFAPCLPGQEAETFERVKKLIAASVPEFQIPHGSPTARSAAR